MVESWIVVSFEDTLDFSKSCTSRPVLKSVEKLGLTRSQMGADVQRSQVKQFCESSEAPAPF